MFGRCGKPQDERRYSPILTGTLFVRTGCVYDRADPTIRLILQLVWFQHGFQTCAYRENRLLLRSSGSLLLVLILVTTLYKKRHKLSAVFSGVCVMYRRIGAHPTPDTLSPATAGVDQSDSATGSVSRASAYTYMNTYMII